MKLQLIRFGCLLMLALATMVAGPLGCSTLQSSSAQSSDRQLASKVQRVLKRDPVYKFANISVAASNGAVQLSGFTSSQKEKQRAEELAKQVEGVNEVSNKIVVQ